MVRKGIVEPLVMIAIRKQQGLALLMLVFVLVLVAVSYAVSVLDSTDFKQERDRKTVTALAEAKVALLAFSAQTVTPESRVLPANRCDISGPTPTPLNCNCGLNCPRPGDLPCPDVDNDGEADACGAPALGRLPWKTLGLGDLRDSSGERLWYAVSNRYQNAPRSTLPLNSETLGTITLKNAQGVPIYDATSPANTGLAAVVIAPGAVLTRSDETVAQNRAVAQENIAKNYLDVALGENNADSSNGFISGEIKVKVLDDIVLHSNDIILPITRGDMNAVMETRVLTEVMAALLYNVCPVNGANINERVCDSGFVGTYVPDPAAIDDVTCLTSNIANGDCSSDSSESIGRIAVGGNTGSPADSGWESKDQNSILRGVSNHNWFQQNGWRELIFYAVAPACTEAGGSCGVAGTYLTLENSLTPLGAPTPSNKGVVVISAGRMLAALPRDTADITDYLELENEDGSALFSNSYSRYTHNTNRNDRVLSIP